MKVGALTHPAGLAHDAGRGHPERAERLEAILAHLQRTGLTELLEWCEPAPAAPRVVALAHAPAYLDLLMRLDSVGGGRLDPDTGMGPGSLDAALRGSQAAIDASSRVLSGVWDSGVVLMRPPGHHATRDAAMGFCLINHAAVAARWALAEGRARRVLICDWDAHHGNGTQDIFWADDAVLYVSLHQFGPDPLAPPLPFYPGTGAVDEVGQGRGRRLTVNVPLPAGSAEEAYTAALDEVVRPRVDLFDPDLTIVSAGFDAHHADPLCSMRLTAGAFFNFTRWIQDIGKGPVCILEGGYDLDALAWSTGAMVSALVGADSPRGVPAPELEPLEGVAEARLWIDRALQVHENRP